MGSGSSIPTSEIVNFIQKSPISILNWDDTDMNAFSKCFKVVKVQGGDELSTKDQNSLFIVAEGRVDIIAVLPSPSQKKADNIREFLCKKQVGDIVYVPSVRKLISDANAKELNKRETRSTTSHHKNILNFIDSISIKSMEGSTILQLDWQKYDAFNKGVTQRGDSSLDLPMLAAMMETNIADYLQKLPFLKVVPSSKLEILASMCHYEVAPPNTAVCKEGDIGDKVYIILSGEAKVEAFITEDDIRDHREATSSAANSPVHPSNTLGANEASEKSKPTSNSGEGVVRPRRGSVLKNPENQGAAAADTFIHHGQHHDKKMKVPMYTHKRDTIMSHLAKLGETIKDLGHHSFHHGGEKSKSQTEAILASKPKVELARVHPGSYFGEMAAYIDLPRAATVTSVSSCLFATLSRADFKTFLKVVPDIENSIEFMVKQHMLENLIQLKSPFLESVSIPKAHGMASKAHIEQLEPGCKVFEEGNAASKFYFVYSGSLKVEKTKEDEGFVEVGHLYPGDYFGELALINDSPRLATVTSENHVILLSITRDHFHECFEDNPDLVSEFIVRMNGKHVTLEQLLEHKRSKAAFVEHLEQQHGQENLKFYEESTKFGKEFETMTNEEAHATLTSIVDTYVRESSASTVNLPHKISKVIIDELESDNFSAETLAKARTEIFLLMDRDLYQRFKASENFQALMKKLHTYDDLDLQFTS